MINNAVLVSGVQQSYSVIHIHVSALFQILFPFRLLHKIEQTSLYYTVGLCWLSVLFLSFNKFIYFIYLFLAALGLCCCVRAFSSCGERGLLFTAVCRLFIAVASLVAEHGL